MCRIIILFFPFHFMAFFYCLVLSYIVYGLVFPCVDSIKFFLQIFRILMGINVRVLLVLLLLGLGAIFYVGAKTSPIIVFVFSICIISFLFSVYLTKWVLAKDEGPPEMVQVHHLFSVSSAHDVIVFLSVCFHGNYFW